MTLPQSGQAVSHDAEMNKAEINGQSVNFSQHLAYMSAVMQSVGRTRMDTHPQSIQDARRITRNDSGGGHIAGRWIDREGESGPEAGGPENQENPYRS